VNPVFNEGKNKEDVIVAVDARTGLALSAAVSLAFSYFLVGRAGCFVGVLAGAAFVGAAFAAILGSA
jgi:hypothetical protein